jgi:N-acetylglucosaminyl-diphospho-decaprenol L-rhamnosyltransferase
MAGGVEVLIAHRNNAAQLRRCLDALAGQTVLPAICVIDDASTDETPDVIPAAYPDVRYLRLDRNEGFSRANNHGIRTSTAQWVVLLNNDTVPEPNFIEALQVAWSHSESDMVAATLRTPAGPVDSAGIEVDRSLVAFDLLHGHPYDPEAIARLEPLAPCAGDGAYRRDALLEVGGFDEAMFAYLEDVELGVRLRMAGARCAVAPGTFAWHEHSAFWGSGSARKNRRMGDSRGYLCWKYGRDLTLGERARGWAIDGVVYAGQIAIDRNAGALQGRLEGWRRRRGLPLPAAHPQFERVPRRDLSVRSALRRRLGRRR